MLQRRNFRCSQLHAYKCNLFDASTNKIIIEEATSTSDGLLLRSHIVLEYQQVIFTTKT